MKFKCPACQTVFSAKTVPFAGMEHRQVARCPCGGMVDAKDEVPPRRPLRWVMRQLSGIAGILAWSWRKRKVTITVSNNDGLNIVQGGILNPNRPVSPSGDKGKDRIEDAADESPPCTCDTDNGEHYDVCAKRIYGNWKRDCEKKSPASSEPEPKYPACNCNRKEGETHKPDCARMVWFLANAKSECPDCGHLFPEEENVCFWCGVVTRKKIVKLSATNFVNLTIHYLDDIGATILEGQMTKEKIAEMGIAHCNKFDIHGQIYQVRDVDPGFGLTTFRAIRIK